MDIKRLFTSMLFAGALMLVFMYFMKGKDGGGAASTLAPFNAYTHVADFKGPEDFKTGEKGASPDTRVLGDISPNAATDDKFAITVSNVTAGIDRVLLKDYGQTIGKKDPLILFQSIAGKPKPFATTGIHIKFKGEPKEILYGTPPKGADDAESIARANATCLLDSQYVWKFEKVTGSTVEMSIALDLDGKPFVKLIKTIEIRPASYDLTISHTIENYSGRELEVGIDQLGGIELSRDDPQMDDRYFMGMPLSSAKLYVNDRGAINITHQQMPKALAGVKNEYVPGLTDAIGTKTLPQMNDYTKDPVLWVASSNRFFATIIRPAQESTASDVLKLAGADGTPDIHPAHHVKSANVDLITVDDKHPEEDLAILRLNGAMLPVAAGSEAAPAKLTEPLAVFFGPKQEAILKGGLATPGTPPYEHAAYQYIKVVQFNTCYVYSFCVNGTLVYSLLWVLDFLAKHVAFGNYGLAIMILVILVRACLHPLTRASQVNMAKMGKQMRDIQPKLDAVKKRYADNKEKQTQETMKLYRENNINPAGGVLGCLPMMLQLPIWAALMAGLRLDIDLRHASFIPGWINDLSNPDTVFPPLANMTLGHPLFTLPLLNFPIYGLNPLPILLGVVLFLNMKVTMASQPRPADDQQAKMQKWSQYSIFMLPFFLYNASSGSNLYFFASTMGGLVDTYFIRKSLKKKGILPPSAKDLPTSEPAK